MNDGYRLHGFTSATESTPSFSTPVFKKGDFFYVQIISSDDLIADFEEVKNISEHCHESRDDRIFRSGDKAIFAIRDKFNYLTVETKENLERYIESKIKYYIHVPFFYKSASEFCKTDLPEYLGCTTAKDFLIRQIISNSALEFTKEINKEKHTESFSHNAVTAKSMTLLMFNQILPHNPRRKRETTLGLYESFIDYAAGRNHRLASEKIIIESLLVSKLVLPESLTAESSMPHTIRTHLIRVLEDTRDAEVAPTPAQQRRLIWDREPKSNLAKWNEEYDKLDKQSRLNAVAMIIFVTSIFSQISDDNR
jgi:hypothetical protein